jgi:chromosome segregation ATPase
MNSPNTRPRSDYLPGIAVRDGFVFMNGEPVATLTKADRVQHAVQDFKDLVANLDRAGLQCAADVDDYRVSSFLESQIEDLNGELKDAEQLESELNDLIGDLRMELEVTNRLNDELEAKIAELQDRAREDA